jgi:hypothetical protein
MASSGTSMYRRLARRWYFTLVGLAVTAALCVAAVALVPVTYQAKAEVLLSPPQLGGPQGTNSYFALANLQPLADAVALSMTSSSNVSAIGHQGFEGSFTVVRDLATDAPILIVTADGKTPSVVLKNLELLLATATPAVRKIQDGIPTSQLVESQVITQPNHAPKVYKATIRALVVAAALGLLITASATAAADEFLLRRRRRRNDDAASDADDGSPADDAATAPSIEESESEEAESALETDSAEAVALTGLLSAELDSTRHDDDDDYDDDDDDDATPNERLLRLRVDRKIETTSTPAK